jgi:hypothetical protein
MSQTYLIFHTLLLLSPLTCMTWINLTRTNVIFSRITLGVYFWAEIHFPRKFPEIHQNYISPKTLGARRTTRGGPPGHQRVARLPPLPRLVGSWRPRATSLTPLWYLGHFVPETENPQRIFPNTIRSSADTRNPSSEFSCSYSGTLSGQILEGRSSPSSPPTPLHQPSMIPTLMCEWFPAVGRGYGRDWMWLVM